MTLHLSQIALTLARTFISASLHQSLSPVYNTSPTQVVRGNLQLYLIARQNTNKVHPHFAANVREHHMTIFQANPEHGVGQRFFNRALNLNYIFLGHNSRRKVNIFACLERVEGLSFAIF